MLLQNRYKNIVAQLFDECYMFGRTLNGHIAHRCGEVFDEGKQQNDILGNIPVSILFGDAQQLNPVLDSAPYISNASRSQVINLGILFYQAHDRIFVLNQNH